MKTLHDRKVQLQASTLAPSTIRARKYQWNCYLDFCARFNVKALPCSNNQLSLYVSFLSYHMCYTSVVNYLQGIILAHKFKGHVPPSVSSDDVKLALQGLKNIDVGSIPRDPVTLSHLKLMFACVNTAIKLQLMFWAALLLLFRSLLRVSHITESPHCLRVGDVEFVGDGLVLKVYSSKAMKKSKTPRLIPIAPLECRSYCAVYWLKRWLSNYKSSPSSPLFSLDGSPLTYSTFSNALSKVILRAGIKEKISSHSFRQGGATFLSTIGMPIDKIKDRGGWASNAVFKFISESLDVKAQCDGKVAKVIDF